MKSFAKRVLIGAALFSSFTVVSWAQTTGTTFHVEDLEPIDRNFSFISSNEIADEITGNGNKIDWNGIIKSSIEGDSLIMFGRNSFLKGIINAYASHRAVELSPDMIWLLICQGFAYHVNNNAEELRDRIVYHEDKMTLTVITEYDLMIQSDSVKWERIFDDFENQIRSNTKGNLADIITADFSTTGINEKIASQITLMESTKSYFEYKMILMGCGIPDITLRGTTQDWRKVRDKALSLKGYGMDWWIDELEPILNQFIKASQGLVDKDFWMGMVGSADFRKKGCGGPSNITEILFDGWIVSFFPYNKYGDRIQTVRYNDNLLPEIVETPFTYEIQDGLGNCVKSYSMVLYAGFLGLSENPENGALIPRIGWMVGCQLSDNEMDYTSMMQQEKEQKIIDKLIHAHSNGHRPVARALPLIVVDGNIVTVDDERLTELLEILYGRD